MHGSQRRTLFYAPRIGPTSVLDNQLRNPTPTKELQNHWNRAGFQIRHSRPTSCVSGMCDLPRLARQQMLHKKAVSSVATWDGMCSFNPSCRATLPRACHVSHLVQHVRHNHAATHHISCYRTLVLAIEFSNQHLDGGCSTTCRGDARGAVIVAMGF
jgi:hypothetical protein